MRNNGNKNSHIDYIVRTSEFLEFGRKKIKPTDVPSAAPLLIKRIDKKGKYLTTHTRQASSYSLTRIMHKSLQNVYNSSSRLSSGLSVKHCCTGRKWVGKINIFLILFMYMYLGFFLSFATICLSKIMKLLSA